MFTTLIVRKVPIYPSLQPSKPRTTQDSEGPYPDREAAENSGAVGCLMGQSVTGPSKAVFLAFVRKEAGYLDSPEVACGG